VLLDASAARGGAGGHRPGLENSPNNHTAWARRGQVLRRMRRYEDSITSYERAVALDPTYAWAWNGKGLCLSALNRWAEAAECYQAALEHDQRDVWFWHNYGEAMAQLGQLDEAEEIFEQALSVDPHHQPTIQKLRKLRENPRGPEE
jgi:tetratricopeptide (TPR) repeat protein